MDKYEMIPLENGCYRIKALKDFSDVFAGDLGGIIERAFNLSQRGDCWIYPDAAVIDRAQVSGDAKIVSGRVCDDALVFGNAVINEHAIICNDARVCGFAKVSGFAKVGDCATVRGYALVSDSAEIAGNVMIDGEACIIGNAYVESISDYIVFKNWWSSGRYFTWTRSNNKWKVGCFHGTGAELIKKAYEDSEESGKRYEEIVKYVENIIK